MSIDPVLFAKAIADDTRQDIMRHLCCNWLSVNELVERSAARSTRPTVMPPLKKLEEASLVLVRQEGRQRFYTLNQQQMTPVVASGAVVRAGFRRRPGIDRRFGPHHAASFRTNISIVINTSGVHHLDKSTIHQAVRQRYGALAETGARHPIHRRRLLRRLSGEGDCGCGADLYDASLLEGLPVDVTGLSLGCGDPVTMRGAAPRRDGTRPGSGGGIDCFLAARQVGETGYVIGVDMTPAMLAKANASKAPWASPMSNSARGRSRPCPSTTARSTS